jgi:RND family efflux transporter MFP subunit
MAMFSQNHKAFALLLLPIVLAACGKKEEVAGPPPVRPVKIFTVEGGSSEVLRSFPGVVEASQRADVAFRVAGQLSEMSVREGDLVAEGQVLAKLDPTDYKIIVEDREATFENASSNFERAKELIVDGNISKFDYDKMEANFRTSRAALTAARQDLEYTELKAPFAGRIALRNVENFEDVLAKQTVFRLQNVSDLDVAIDLPESLIRSFHGRDGLDEELAGDKAVRSGVKAYAAFEGRADNRFALKIKEVATKADSQTQTFQVTFTMPSPESFNVLPGMTANVEVDFADIIDTVEVKWVPATAVQADSDLTARIWVLDAAKMTVSSQPVKIGRMAEGRIEVHDGLRGGEEIVSVGAAYLSEGETVTRFQQGEQAVPRADDPA